MAIKGQSLKLHFLVWDTISNSGAVGDADNLTLRWVADGVAAAPTNAPVEIDPTVLPGIYSIQLTAAECNCNVGTIAGISDTDGVRVIQFSLVFTDSDELTDLVLNTQTIGPWESGSFGELISAKLSLITVGSYTGVVITNGRMNADGSFDIVQGDDVTYPPLEWVKAWPYVDVDSATISICDDTAYRLGSAVTPLEKACSVAVASGAITVQAELTATETGNLPIGALRAQVYITTVDNKKITMYLGRGRCLRPVE